MNIESNRLNTFANWPTSAPVDPIRIAKAGFYYTGHCTEVQCFCCGGKISTWNYGDQVMLRHRQMEPNCPYVVNPQLTANVPLILESSSRSTSISRSDQEEEHHPGDFGPNNYGMTAMDELYQSDALRLLSFANWEDNSVSRESLVNAGFYHAGEGRLRCAWCGGELAPFRCFGALGPPLEVHRMYFPRCTHAMLLEAAQIPTPSFSPSITPPLLSPQTNENVPQSSGAAHNSRLLTANATWRALGVIGGSARHPNKASLAARLATYTAWPADRAQTPLGLADAGFYYTGADDQVRCFYCDGGLGKWEAGDAPWSEHAHWFPHCGYVLLIKGQEFIEAARQRPNVSRTLSSESGPNNRRRNINANSTPITQSQIDNDMESPVVLAVLGAGLDAARVRRAVIRRLRTTGVPFGTSEALIDAVLNDQLNEESWSVSPHSQRLARDILDDTLREFASFRSESNRSESSTPPRSPSPDRSRTQNNLESSRRNTQLHNNLETPRSNPQDNPENFRNTVQNSLEIPRSNPEIPRRNPEIPISNPQNNLETARSNRTNTLETSEIGKETDVADNGRSERDRESSDKKVSLEEENRQLKEARLCKVCMDSEVSVVFLPCGHLVSCAGCGAALSACPLCRADVKALVRAYLA